MLPLNQRKKTEPSNLVPEMKKSILISLCATICISLVGDSELRGQTTGPENGWLIIAGGAVKDKRIMERFLDLAGGPDVPIVVIPTASGQDSFGPYWRGLIPFKKAGASNIRILHTTDPEEANQEEFYSVIDNANGVWFTGGRQWRLADAYLNTKTHDALWRLLDRDGVIGGSSAGATIQGSYLARGDSETNVVMMGDHEEGLSFIKNVAIDQHLLKRNRHFDLLEIVEQKNELLGIGIDENTAIVVRGNNFDVIGRSYVAIYDYSHSIDKGGRFYFLGPDDHFNMNIREPFRVMTQFVPLNRIEPKSWDLLDY